MIIQLVTTYDANFSTETEKAIFLNYQQQQKKKELFELLLVRNPQQHIKDDDI